VDLGENLSNTFHWERIDLDHYERANCVFAISRILSLTLEIIIGHSFRCIPGKRIKQI